MDDGVLRSVSSQLSYSFRSKNGSFLNSCFDAINSYFPDWHYPYLVVDAGMREGTSDWSRIRSKIFPENGNLRVLCFVPHLNK
jgi:hypothetical protein